MALPFSDTFDVDGPLGPPDYLNYEDVLGWGPGLDPPSASGGLLVGVDPESAPMLVVDAAGADNLAATIGPTAPTMLMLALAPVAAPTSYHQASIFPANYNWTTGPDFSELFAGAFDPPLAEGDVIEARVRDDVCSLWRNGVLVNSAADPVGLTPLNPVIELTGAEGSVASIAVTGSTTTTSTLLDVAEAIAAALAPLGGTIPGLQVTAYLNPNPTPPSIDVYPADAFQSGLGFGDDADTFWTIRARTTTADHVAGQKALLRMLDRSGPGSVEQALVADQTLGGVVQTLAVDEDGVSGYRVYLEDPQGNGSLIGVEWRLEVITK